MDGNQTPGIAVAGSPRIVGYDIARALAVFGMVIVNFKVVLVSGPIESGWLANSVALLEGRAAATFVILAGMGLSLMSKGALLGAGQTSLPQVRRTLLKRALFLFLAGLAYTPIWPADILHFYGVYIALGALLIAVPTRRLWMLAAGLVLSFGLLLLVLDYEQGWHWDTLSYEGFWTPAGMLRHLFFNGFHPVVPWAAFLFAGMALGRLDLGIPAIRQRLFLWGAGLAVASEGLSGWLVRTSSTVGSPADQEALAALLGTAPMPPVPLYILAAGGTACAVIAVSTMAGARWGQRSWLGPLIATGQLALTLYVAHVVIGMGTLEAAGRLGGQTLPFAVGAAAVFCLAGVAFSQLWRRRFSRGPVEALMRVLTTSRR